MENKQVRSPAPAALSYSKSIIGTTTTVLNLLLPLTLFFWYCQSATRNAEFNRISVTICYRISRIKVSRSSQNSISTQKISKNVLLIYEELCSQNIIYRPSIIC